MSTSGIPTALRWNNSIHDLKGFNLFWLHNVSWIMLDSSGSEWSGVSESMKYRETVKIEVELEKLTKMFNLCPNKIDVKREKEWTSKWN